jgi:alcohol dehydrogenase
MPDDDVPFYRERTHGRSAHEAAASMISLFTLSRTPKIVFGPDSSKDIGTTARGFGTTALVITSGSLVRSGKMDEIALLFHRASLEFSHVTLSGEPTPDFIDETVLGFKNKGVDVVIAIGGGSAMDAGKAVSAMLPQTGSVTQYLEGIGGEIHDGRKIPFVAVPTTAGTGSEATKNAVLRRVGPDGFKRSIRHDNFIPDVAFVDPALSVSSPPAVSAACGMDALTQLIESYVSRRANPLTDALAKSGMAAAGPNLVAACTTSGTDLSVRGAMAYASLLSGITLANAGLGVIHGMASPLGGYFDIPHGVACGTLLSAATKKTIEALRAMGMEGEPGLRKYAGAGAIISGRPYRDESDVPELCDLLVDTIRSWTDLLSIPRLSAFGVTGKDIDRIIDGAGNKENPAPLDRGAMRQILQERL